MTTAVIVTAI